MLEKGKDIAVVRHLGFSRCRLSIAVPRDVNYSGRQWLSGKRIATSYPAILKAFLNQNAIDPDIQTISGLVEITPGIEMAVDIF